MKKLYAMLIVVVCLSACSANPQNTDASNSNTPSTDTGIINTATTDASNSNTPSADAGIINTANPTMDHFELVDAKVTKENFVDKYYEFMLDETATGIWTQQDVTFFLTKYVQEDIKKNGEHSKFSFVKKRKIPFLYAVNTSTGTNIIYFLIGKREVPNRFLSRKFLSVGMTLRYYDSANFETYEFGTINVEDVVLKTTDDFVDYLNNDNNIIRFVFFERGWLEID